MATKKPQEVDVSLPFAALRLLAPPVRLVSAAMWKVMKQRDVMQYGIVEEFVTSACETVPGLLTLRHQSKLTLGLRGRLILELCRAQPDAKVIERHLIRIRVPAPPSTSSAPAVKKDVKVERTVECFHSFIHTLLTDPAEKEQFFKEEFPEEYGPNFDEELEKLLWEFLIRLDQLLPAPNLSQTVSWLSDAPPVLEECARSATQPQLLNILLQHQTCLGHLEPAASLPPNMGNSILDSLSLPLSGKSKSNQSAGTKMSASVQSVSDTQTRGKTPFIRPVIGLISNKDVPVMISASKRAQRCDGPARKEDATSTHRKMKENSEVPVVKLEEERNVTIRNRGVKRKQPDIGEFEEDEDESDMTRSGNMGKKISRVGQSGDNQKTNETEGGEAKTVRDSQSLVTAMTQLGITSLHVPDDPFLCAIFMSCLKHQPRVVIEKLPDAVGNAHRTAEEGNSTHPEHRSWRKKSPIKALVHKSTSVRHVKLELDISGLDDKENHPVLPSVSRSPQLRSNTEMLALPGVDEEYVADSEDEATKNFKGRLFIKRYYKTKHGTYVPTLREYWKPGAPRRDLLSTGSKHR